jgi:hypothetical protein
MSDDIYCLLKKEFLRIRPACTPFGVYYGVGMAIPFETNRARLTWLTARDAVSGMKS